MNELTDPTPFSPNSDPANQDWIGQPGSLTAGENDFGRRGVLDLPQLRGFLFRQRKIFLGVIALSILLGVLATLLVRPTYEAEATVRVDPEGNTIVEGQDLAPTIATNQVYQYLETLGEVIESRRLATKVVEIAKLDTNEAFLDDSLEGERLENMTDEQWGVRKAEIAAAKVQDNVIAEIPFESRIITIKFRGDDPQLAANIANAYAQAFVLNDTETRLEANTYALDYLTSEISDIRDKLQTAEVAANDYARSNGIVSSETSTSNPFTFSGTTSSTITADSLARINAGYTDARAKRLQFEQRWAAIRNAPPMQISEVQQSIVIQELQAERSRTASALADLRERYDDNFPQVAELAARLNEIESQITLTGNDIKAGLQNEYRIAVQQERALERELSSVSAATLNEQDRRVQYELLDREAGALRLQLAALLQRYNDIAAAENVQPGSITLLDGAIVPNYPVSPSLFRNLLIALIIGAGAAGVMAILREVLDDRLRSLEDVEEKFGVPLLGHTPFVNANDIEEEANKPFGALIESYSSIVSTLDYMMPFNGQALQFTSSQSSEGKTTTARVVAERYAQLGRKTLLIDADLRRPSISKHYGFERTEKGLVEAVLGHCSLQDALLPLERENLDVLPMGKVPPNPVELLSSEAFAQFVANLRDGYSRIIFDASPVMGIADAPLLSRHVDGTVFIVEANRVHFGQAKASLRRLRSVGARLSGVILTKYRALEAGQPYGYEYRYYDYASE
ncbi:Succinoglycan biosynthesis transport protein ExoP [Altererythrobacter insulae]|nr:Succinoglycan biosynthesis transport protein ExoP [Altererythrobacter insulae]